VKQLFLATAAALALIATGAFAQYPDKPIHLVVPYDPGVVDATARVIAKGIGDYLNVPVVIDNIPGASGSIGASRVAKAAPDGYTLFYGTATIFVQNPMFYKLTYDPQKDLAPVSHALDTGLFLLVNKSLGVKNLSEFIALAKANPGKFSYGFSGNGAQVANEVFKRKAGLNILPVPYRSSNTSIVDLLAGRISMLLYTWSAAEQHIKAGDLVALAYTGKSRLPSAPQVPTFAESGFPGFDHTLWFGFFVPTGTPQPIVNKLNAAVNAALNDEGLKKFSDYVVKGSTVEELGAYVRSEAEKGKVIARDLGIKPE